MNWNWIDCGYSHDRLFHIQRVIGYQTEFFVMDDMGNLVVVPHFHAWEYEDTN